MTIQWDGTEEELMESLILAKNNGKSIIGYKANGQYEKLLNVCHMLGWNYSFDAQFTMLIVV